LIEPFVERTDDAGVGCYLESSKESNVAFYRRFGFEVTDVLHIDRGRGPDLFLMWRDPR
jgi:ribosomal protein S18 acetylase RimI-like enzyme